MQVKKRKTPPIRRLTRILIICEGHEEYDYLTVLTTLSVWSNRFEITLKNACSIDNVPGQYQYEFASGNYDAIYIFCDTELPPFRQFTSVLAKINSTRGKSVAKKIVCFANPCTMQIVLSHFDQVRLTSNQKSVNADLIAVLTGINDYRARRYQREKLSALINRQNYEQMKYNISFLDTDYRVTPATNAASFFDGLESGKIKLD